MTWATVWMFRWCAILLAHYHTAGVYLVRMRHNASDVDRYYAGNFWWARASYLSALSPDHVVRPLSRYDAEVWVGAPLQNTSHLRPALGRYACLLQPSSFQSFESFRYLNPRVYHAMAATVWEHRPGNAPRPLPPKCIVSCLRSLCGGKDPNLGLWGINTLSPA